METYRGRVVLLGDSKVGKTSIILQYTDGHLSRASAGLVVEKKVKTLEVGSDKVQLHIWDTAGQERHDSLSLSYCRNAGVVLLVYDVMNMDSFQNVTVWGDRVGIDVNDVDVVLVGNKSDLPGDRVVTTVMGEAKAKELLPGGVKFFETSAKKNININATFEYVASVIQSKKNAKRGIASDKPDLSNTDTSSSQCCKGN